ncbi:MAG: family 16 glycosylhydrolase, partial [Saprospiraceae bacterium]|nr:family 16 glycosylhydrolase [Saprospiraceae bacterium]
MRFILTTVLVVLGVCSHIAQTTNVFDDFEGNGTISLWTGDDCNTNAALPNPYKSDLNASNTVLEYHDVGGQYANVRFEVEENFDLSTNSVFQLKIYIPSTGLTGNQPNQVSLKLQDGKLEAPWSTQSEIKKSIARDQWQTIYFDFKNDNYINIDGSTLPPTQRTDFNRVVIQVNGENNNDFVLAYIDDVTLDDYQVPGNPVYDYLIWSDEFDGEGAIDDEKWFHQTELPNGESWFNGEIQHYTDREDNAYLEDGLLKMVAKRENFTDQGVTKQYTSARLNSKFAFTYGRVEIRAKLPTGVGTWPALWTLGQNIDENGGYWDNEGYDTTPWPACGEMDIMEHWGNNQNYVSSATHTPSSHGNTVNVGGQVIPTVSSEFHVYEMIWTPKKLIFSVDGGVHFVYEPEVRDENTWPFDAPQYFLFNIAIQGNILPSFVESSMDVDYIRVFQESPSTAVTELPKKETLVYPNPVLDQLTIEVSEAKDQPVVLSMYNSMGALVKTESTRLNSDKITISNLERLT